MSRKNIITVLVSIVVGGFFFWLAVHNVDFEEVYTYIAAMSWTWVVPFALVSTGANYLRSERWRLLVRDSDGNRVPRNTLFTGVMLAYLVNYAVPRLGEVSRCVYVSKHSDIKTSTLFGTVVLERIIDVICLGFLLIFVFFYVLTDPQIINQLFGSENVAQLKSLYTAQNILLLVLAGIFMLGLALGGYRLLQKGTSLSGWIGKTTQLVLGVLSKFAEGILAIRKLSSWPQFIILTFFMWTGYVLMAYIPFYAFPELAAFGLTVFDAVTVMILAAVGVAFPSPGGLGTYHWVVKQTLSVIYAVPVVTGLSYAFVSHFFNLLVILVVTPIVLVMNSALKKRKK